MNITTYKGAELKRFKAFVAQQRTSNPAITSTTICLNWAGGHYGTTNYFLAQATINELNREAKK